MTPEQQQEYDEYCEMFATAGWKRYISQMHESRAANLAAAPEAATSNEAWQYCRGLLAQMLATMGFENYVHLVQEQTIEEEKEKAEDDDSDDESE